MDNSCFNSYKIDIYCRLANYAEEFVEKQQYTIKDCDNALYKLTLASAMFKAICGFCLNDDDENYCLSEEDLCKVVTYIRNLLKVCNC